MYKKEGFTLIELLIVVAIIAILAAIALPNYMAAQARAKTSRAQAELKTIGTAIESYYVDNNEYPPENFDSPTNTILGNLYSTPNLVKLIRLTTPVSYITSVPNDPFTSILKDRLNRAYHYAALNDPYYPGNPFFAGDNEEHIVSQWILESYGPDGTPYPYEFPRYDPTNGTNSVGNIMRFGP
jgi:type II secretion system protein G